MIKADYHMHTIYSDGIASPEEMILKGIYFGLEEIGISDHSFTFFDTSYCMQEEKIDSYKEELERLKEKYKGKINVLKGIEQDYYSDVPADDYDYVIGSVHYLFIDGSYVPVDETPEILRSAADRYFGGDILSLCELYYATVSDVVKKTGADIIGHFDLISKFNDGKELFDPEDPRYIAAWNGAADKLLETGVPFEINTGAVSRGYKEKPYPSPGQIEYIREKGGRFILSSDAHSPEGICFGFAEFGE
ncbi:MAG: histidinol-phosphatase [Firmicutes bacterium]|nr:histidinol-phosphatase [Bacillota bacterium]